MRSDIRWKTGKIFSTDLLIMFITLCITGKRESFLKICMWKTFLFEYSFG